MIFSPRTENVVGSNISCFLVEGKAGHILCFEIVKEFMILSPSIKIISEKEEG
jgi:hypothetical protein